MYNAWWYLIYNHICISGLRETPYFAQYSRTRLLIHTVISSKYFDLAIAGVIGLNVITMAMEFYMMPAVRSSWMSSFASYRAPGISKFCLDWFGWYPVFSNLQVPTRACSYYRGRKAHAVVQESLPSLASYG